METLTQIFFTADHDASITQIKVRNDMWVAKGSIVAIATGQNSAVVRIKAPKAGKVVNIKVSKGDSIQNGAVIAELSDACSHSTLMKDMCADCGADLRQIEYEQGVPATSSATPATATQEGGKKATVAMVHSIPELKVSAEEAKKLGLEDERRLRDSRRLVLLVDLDQTIIHTTNENVAPNLKDVLHFQLSGPRSPWYHTRIRPGTSRFLENVGKLYELHICTFGARMYAHKIASLLDPDGKIFSHRILSRDECFDNRSKTANLSSLFPCGDHMVCIIDDREDVWNFAPNLVHVKPYSFFKNTGDINDPSGFKARQLNTLEEKSIPSDEQTKNESPERKSGEEDLEESKIIADKEGEEGEAQDDIQITEDDSSQDASEGAAKKPESSYEKVQDEESLKDDLFEVDDTDDYLVYLEDILTTVHTAYYDLYKQMKERGEEGAPDLKTVIPYVKRKALQGTNLVFSGVVPTNVPLRKSRAYMVARSLGANVDERLSAEPGQETTHLIAARLGTAKVHEARRFPKVQVVTPDWLWCCAERWEHIDERLFTLSKKAHVTLKPPAHCSSPEIAFAERCAASLQRQQSNTENLPEAMNPFLTFSKDDLSGMGKEVEDELTDSSSSSSSENTQRKRKANDEDSSSEDSLSADAPKGWQPESKRSREDDDSRGGEEEEEEEEDDDEDEFAKAMAESMERELFEDASN